jgi:RNA polymerase sigma-70 factor (ECF subfamily)
VPLHAAEAREAGGADVEQRLVLWAEVAKLPQKEGEAVVLFYYQDWSVRQVADSLGTSDNAVRLRLMRARDRLAQPLKEASIRG